MATRAIARPSQVGAVKHDETLSEPRGLWSWITTIDHKRIGIMYMVLGLVMFLRGFADAIMAPNFWVIFELLPKFGVNDLFAGLPRLTRWYEALEADPVSGPMHRDYLEALRQFLASRMKTA